MSGYAARLGPSVGVHDPLTVRALILGGVCWIAVDVCGLHEDSCRRIAERVDHPTDQVRVTATHTHSGPAVMPGRLGGADRSVLNAVVAAAVHATAAARLDLARRTRRQVDLVSIPVDGVAFDRRRRRPVAVPLDAVVVREADRVVAAMLVFPCHPVVLSAANRQISGDYPAYLRRRLEDAWPGATVLFAPGCAGDVNTGHTAASSYAAGESATRSFAEAERVGSRLADRLLAALDTAPRHDASVLASARSETELGLRRLDPERPADLAERWGREVETVDPGTAAVLRSWIDWAEDAAADDRSSWTGTVSVARLRDGWLVGLPGEPFLGVAELIRADLGPGTVVVGYTDGCPGYFPLRTDYPDGGYEVVDAHRYYGLPAPFAAGAAEQLVGTVHELAADLVREQPRGAAC